MARRRGWGGRPVGRGRRLALVAASALLVGCSGDGGATAPDDGPATPGLSPTPPDTAGRTDDTPMLSADGSVDCSAVAAARDELLAATDAELARLDVDRSDREAFGITLFVATRHAPRYWAAVRDAVTADADERLRSEVADVASHWGSLADDLAAVEVADGSAAAVRRALDELDDVRDALPAERVETVQAAQERAQTDVDRACGDPLTSGLGVVPGDSTALGVAEDEELLEHLPASLEARPDRRSGAQP